MKFVVMQKKNLILLANSHWKYQHSKKIHDLGVNRNSGLKQKLLDLRGETKKMLTLPK